MTLLSSCFERPDFFLRPVKGHSHVWGPKSLPPLQLHLLGLLPLPGAPGSLCAVVTSFQRKPEQLSQLACPALPASSAH